MPKVDRPRKMCAAVTSFSIRHKKGKIVPLEPTYSASAIDDIAPTTYKDPKYDAAWKAIVQSVTVKDSKSDHSKYAENASNGADPKISRSNSRKVRKQVQTCIFRLGRMKVDSRSILMQQIIFYQH